MAFADVEIRILQQENGYYPVEITVNTDQKFPRGKLDVDLENQPATPTDALYADSAYGQALFNWFFTDTQLVKNWAEIRGADPQRRVRLRIDADEPKLHQVPWEAFCEPKAARQPALHLAAHSATPFSRYLADKTKHGKPVFKRPIRILMVVPRQADFIQKYPDPKMVLLEPDAEYQNLRQAIQPLLDKQHIQLDLLPQPCTLAAIVSKLSEARAEGKGYHILHFVCHGFYINEKASLVLSDANNQVQVEAEDQIAGVLAQQLVGMADADENSLRLVFLASCESAKRSSAAAYRGLAPKLVAAGVPAVVAMQNQVSLATAQQFAKKFYAQLLQHGQVDLAANEARQVIMAANQPGPVIPVLFLRLTDGQLFARKHTAPVERVRFDGLLEEYTKFFAGRDDVIVNLEAFMQNPDGGYLLVTAGAGLGKTALMANLVACHRDTLAYHFFSPRISESLQEAVFLRNLLEQMGSWYGESVPLTGPLDELGKYYDKFLGESPQGIHTIVLDGLDEVTGWKLERYFTRRLPTGLNFILTVRDVGQDTVKTYSLPAEQVQRLPISGLDRKGVQAVLHAVGKGATQFADDDGLLDQVLRVTQYDQNKPELGADSFFVRFLAEDAATGDVKPEEMGHLPAKMTTYLDRWWSAIKTQFGEEGNRRKREQAMVDLAGTLAAALGPISQADLEAINPSLVSDIEINFVETVVKTVQRIVVLDQDGNYTLLHPRLRDYLRQKLRIGTYTQRLLNHCAQWASQEEPNYALAYYARHLAAAAQAATQPNRHTLTERLVRLVMDAKFQDAYLKKVKDRRGLQADLARALQTTVADDAPGYLPLLVESALGQVRFRRERLQPGPLFKLAAQGDIAGARRMLELFEMDSKWQQIALLAISWLAGTAPSSATHNQADNLRAEVAEAIKDLPEDDQRKRLLRWIKADLEGAAKPQGELPGVPTTTELRAMLNLAAGVGEADVSPEMRLALSGLDWERLANGTAAVDGVAEMSEDMFFSYYIGPKLVALACAEPQTGEQYLREYFDIHSAYNYAAYRFGSLWALLRSILQYPQADWIKEKVRALLSSALSGSSMEFEEGVPVTVLALRAQGGEHAAAKLLADYSTRVQQEAGELRPGDDRGDTWGHYKRLLATLAQIKALLGVDVGVSPQDLLHDAMYIPYGYAGYQAPACLALAEAIRICQPPEAANWIAWTLHNAQEAAHNVQEGTFCVRTTARINAMRAKWWSALGLDVRAESLALYDNPQSQGFSALHYMNHVYGGRSDPPSAFPLPSHVKDANTLTALAKVYQRSLPEFLRLNRQWEPNQIIPKGEQPEGEKINVPDPGLTPLLAARLAAEALVASGLTKTQRADIIRKLVPVATSNATALDSVLTRLLLAEAPTDPAILATLAALAPLPQTVQPINGKG